MTVGKAVRSIWKEILAPVGILAFELYSLLTGGMLLAKSPNVQVIPSARR